MSIYGKLLEFNAEEKVRFDYVILEKFLQAYPRLKQDVVYHINIDPVTFTSPTFVDDLKVLFENHHFTDNQNISLEVTENGSMNTEEIQVLNQSIQRLRGELGIRI